MLTMPPIWELLSAAPALRIVRRDDSDDGRLLELADNVHPSDRFTYQMQLRK